MTRLQGKAGDPVINVIKIDTEKDLDQAKKIRYDVFVVEQHVPMEEELDQFENESTHFIAFINEIPCGAARWRFTKSGIKLERFAVLKDFRRLGVGSELVTAVLTDIQNNPGSHGKKIYLHSQLKAVPLYSKFGFRQIGELFQECDIDHYKMVKY